MAYYIVSKNEMFSFITRAIVAVGAELSHAETLAEVLIAGDYRGHYSHGLNRLELYIKDLDKKACIGTGQPAIVKQTVATAHVDGNNLLGPVVGKFSMNLAIEKAKQVGIGLVVAKQSNHFGIAGFYSLLAVQQGLIGMSFTNASPLVATTRGKEPFFGTNPLSFTAPGKNGDNFVLDMATSVVALGKVEIAARKGEKIPEGWGVDKNGEPITEPKDLHALLPLGGPESSSGYKGYGLGMLVEILCGVLSGAAVAPHIRNWQDNQSLANLGQCFLAIDPNCFASGFEDRMSHLINDCRNQVPAKGEPNVLVAGDPERIHMEKCDQQGGISYHENQIKFANDIAASLKIEPPKILSK